MLDFLRFMNVDPQQFDSAPLDRRRNQNLDGMQCIRFKSIQLIYYEFNLMKQWFNI
jgi:hypothetical protein